jgi:hypothetical protein
MELVLELAGYFVLQGLDLEGLKGDCVVQARHVSHVVRQLFFIKTEVVRNAGYVCSRCTNGSLSLSNLIYFHNNSVALGRHLGYRS